MTKETDHWMPFYFSDYLRDTSRLTAAGHGAYVLLILDYWVKGPPPDDDDQLAAITRTTPREWQKLRRVIEPFFEIKSGKWTHKRVEKELAKARAMVDQRRAAGRASAEARQRHTQRETNDEATDVERGPQREVNEDTNRDGNETATSLPTKPLRNGRPLPIPLHKEEILNTSSVSRGALRARKAGRTDYSNPENRQAFARSKIAPVIGWEIMMAAEDPEHPDHKHAVSLAKMEATKQQVMWRPPAQKTAGTG